ncbi:MAG: HTH domain-containing protein [Bacilli bacterium]
MATKKFTDHAIMVLNKNPNVVRCTPSKITFTEDFAMKVMDAVKAGDDPVEVFTSNGLSIRILGKTRIYGNIGLWKSRYEIEDAPRRKAVAKPKPEIETAVQRRERVLAKAIEDCDALIADTSKISDLPADADKDIIHFAAIKQVYSTSDTKVIVKDLCLHYNYSYTQYYAYFKNSSPAEEEYVNILNSHRKSRNK